MPFPAKFHTTKNQLFVDANGYDHTLTAVNIWPVWEGSVAWPVSTYNEIRSAGFNAVRFLLPWRSYEPTRGNVQWLAQLDQAVANARAAGLYVWFVFLNDSWNTPPDWATWQAPGIANNPHQMQVRSMEKHRDSGLHFYSTIINRYKANPAVAAFNLIHETHGSNENDRVLRDLWTPFVTRLRQAVGSEPILGIGPGWSNTDVRNANGNLYTGPEQNLYWGTSHYFSNGDPYNEWGMPSGVQMWSDEVPYGGSAAELREPIDIQRAFAAEIGIPFAVDEYGSPWSLSTAEKYGQDWAAVVDSLRVDRGAWHWHVTNEPLALKRNGVLSKAIRSSAGVSGITRTPAPVKVE